MSFKSLRTGELKNLIAQIKEKRSIKCSKCGSQTKFSKRREDEIICEWSLCKFRTNIWKGTIFYKTKLTKLKICRVIEFWMQKASFDLLSYGLRINRKSIWKLMRKVSKRLAETYYQTCPKIGGNGKIAEIDKSKFGKIKYNKGHSVEGVWIFGMVERSRERKIHLMPIEDRKAETLSICLNSNVNSDSVIFSDCWRGYKHILDDFIGHFKVNHSQNFKDPITGTHTNTIEGNWAGIKMHVPFKGRTKYKINLYLIRYMILRNDSTEHPLKAIIKYLF